MKRIYAALSFIIYHLAFSSAAALLMLLVACGTEIPQNYWEKDELPDIYPDYTNVTVPVNIAPLTFQMDGKAANMVATLRAGDEEVIYGGTKVQPSMSEWHGLVRAALSSPGEQPAITVEVYVENNKQWTRFKPFSIYVSPDSIDPYISYRLISPSYVVYEDLTINQRCLENYDESVVYDNMLCSEDTKGQCINCHNYQQYNPERMQFHAREHLGGTIIAYDGNMKKVSLKTDSTLSAGVYPTWHPWLPLIVYSTNHTAQSFHTVDPNKIEVFDSQSDLIVYDVEKDEVTNIENDPQELECFPFWAPDGKTLYYCSAHSPTTIPSPEGGGDVTAEASPSGGGLEGTDPAQEVLMHYEDVKYRLYRKSFDPETKRFGPRETLPLPAGTGVVASSVREADNDTNYSPPSGGGAVGGSCTLPRVSPDGRFLMFTLAPYGIFHIWHHEADLWLMDLETGGARSMDELNSPDTESYHSWSSNGRWVVFSSRRYDGNYTRPYIAHIDGEGRGSKAFELPCADPGYHRKLLKSYNIPEFMLGPVTMNPQQFADAMKHDAKPVTYKPRP